MLGTKGSHNDNSDTALEVPVPTLSPFLLGWEEVRHRETGHCNTRERRSSSVMGRICAQGSRARHMGVA